MLLAIRKVDVRLPAKGNPNSHGARPVHLIITMTKWIRTSGLSIKNSLSDAPRQGLDLRVVEKTLWESADPFVRIVVPTGSEPHESALRRVCLSHSLSFSFSLALSLFRGSFSLCLSLSV